MPSVLLLPLFPDPIKAKVQERQSAYDWVGLTKLLTALVLEHVENTTMCPSTISRELSSIPEDEVDDSN
eukprot:CAMPEP_0180820742 /NCGR_PEP_ID=MMETSP1038_2-20121128/70447_1 /TAXON_ID=632150 /ORGANISM="Azadinium spinosum, Strain 3D9" /LENGTH=68 /DNA_ID=CAMNT_0022862853 /DNA_START=34 /DNA_END=237 /DNA_ORIENTATION=+